ncbi:MAG: hypothetical protein ABSE16_10460 [Verrucomicrobiota bacterium]|jgi:hypothetical protein
MNKLTLGYVRVSTNRVKQAAAYHCAGQPFFPLRRTRWISYSTLFNVDFTPPPREGWLPGRSPNSSFVGIR